MRLSRHFQVLLLIAVIIPSCDAFVCSQQRKNAMETSNKGVLAFKNGLYDTAERELKLAIQTDPTYTLAHYNLGKVYQKQRKWDKAAEAFEAAAEREPGNANYQYDLGEALLEMKKLEKAADALEKASEAEPKNFRAAWRLGVVYKLLEQPKKADAAFRKAIDGNPRFDPAFRDLGYLYLEYDYVKEAAQVFAECSRIVPDAAECLNGEGLARKDLKEFDRATEVFKQAVSLDTSLMEAVYNLGMTYAEWYEQGHAEDHKTKAREYLQKFVSGGGGRDGGIGYVKAANDKLYALSGP